MLCRTHLAVAVMILSASSALAALPPTAQRAKEMAAIAENSQVQAAFEGHPLEAIIFVQPDVYQVKANGCILAVRIATIPGQTVPGPRQFRVEIGTLDCNKNP